ncbi:MAG: efflux RND transporter periplasmic adaptor subunit [Alphaproteobacteria bacterium]
MLKKIIVALVVLTLAGVIGQRIFSSNAPGGGHGMMGGPMPVNVAAVIEKDAQEFKEYSGRLTSVDYAEVRPRVTGTIEQIHFQDGAFVKKGDLLFTIDQRPFVAEIERAEAALASAEAQAGFSKKDFERVAALVKDDFITKRDYDTRRNAANVTAAEVQAAKAALHTARLNLEYTEIRAPIDGRAGRAEITVGNLVQAGLPTAPLLTKIVSTTPIYADFDMDEAAYLSYVQAQTTANDKAQEIPVYIGLAGEKGAPHKGSIKTFDNQLDPGSGTIRVRAILDNPDGSLIPGMFAKVRIALPRIGPVTLIIDRAIGTDQDRKFVYVVGADNVANYREIALGGMADGLRIVNSGLKAGEKIVVSGLQRVMPGAPILPQDEPMEASVAAAQP